MYGKSRRREGKRKVSFWERIWSMSKWCDVMCREGGFRCWGLGICIKGRVLIVVSEASEQILAWRERKKEEKGERKRGGGPRKRGTVREREISLRFDSLCVVSLALADH